jgi:transposase
VRPLVRRPEAVRPTLRLRGSLGERLIAKVPHGHWKTTTFLAGLRNDRIDAPCLFDGPTNGERFLAYVEQFLVPTLKPGDVVVLDNPGSHKGKAVRRTIRAAGARLVFLPKSSPDLNPIEQAFAKLKTLLRIAAARTLDAVSDAAARILATYAHAECANYLGSAGYAYAEMQKVPALCRCRLEWGQHVEAFHSPIRVAVKKPNRDAPPSSTKSNGI